MSVEAPARRARVRVRGLVQGVGFRPFVYRLATERGLTGWVRNDEQGVLLEVQGERCGAFMDALAREKPPLARIDAVEAQPLPMIDGERGFVIDLSARIGAASVAIGPDHAPCRDCLEELFDPGARRYLYPFLNCTNCGPRYTITRALPYDRPQTSMSKFPMCEDCAREYHEPSDRRFHAQPIACPRCGPSLSHEVDEIVARLGAGGIVALKGAGGFLLACDARSASAVASLRTRKQRDGKPFACMVANLGSARALAELSSAEERLLTSSARPIVLVPRAAADGLAPDIAPELACVGLMLPSTPLHYVLFHALAGRPSGLAWLEQPLDIVLVMTSANPGGEPLVIDDEEAAARLRGIADLVVTHGRDIVVRLDDSVVRTIAGAPAFIRRARGYVPEPIRLPVEVPPLLAVGGHLKNTICFARGREAFLSQHVGDLDDAATFRFLRETIEHLGRTLEIAPTLVAHDLHPDFLSTREAQSMGLPLVAVQHHHAHVAAVLAEHGVRGPALGLALDGFGYGSDGGAWGGELLALDGAGFERLGRLRPLRLPGGDAAARAPWRMAAAALHAMGRADEIDALFGARTGGRVVREMLESGVHAPWTSSLGRYFDAACGLLRVKRDASYEGEAPMVLEGLVRSPQVLLGAWHTRRIEGLSELNLLPLLGAVIGRSPQEGAELFHGTLAAALVDWARPSLMERDLDSIALGGGCVMNRVLTELLVAGFAAIGIKALVPRWAPANDGGLALGQAWVAAQTALR